MFSTIYNQSLKFLTTSVSGLETLLESLFTPFSTLLANGGLDITQIVPDWLIGDWLTNLLSHSVITLTLGSGIMVFMTITIIKYIIGIVT